MIREFWQERKEEKRKLKELKKQNKKIPQSKEQKAYKVFGVLFALFLVFGSVFYTCRGSGGSVNFSWDKLIGITDDMKDKLSSTVDKKLLLTNKELNHSDWRECIEVLNDYNVDVVTDEKIDVIKLLNKSSTLEQSISLKNNLVGALSSQLIQQGSYSDKVILVEQVIFQDGLDTYIKSLVSLDLSVCVLSSTLPVVYVTTISKVEVLNNKIRCLDTTMRINNLTDEDNAEIIEVLKKSSLVGIDNYTNELIEDAINDFAEGIEAHVEISGLNIKFVPN